MKKIPLTLFILVAVIMPFGALAAVEQAPGKITYIPLEPLPCPNGTCDQSGTYFPSFISTVFKVLIGFGGLFAVVMIVIAGIGYMLSESAIDISKAKSRAQAALWGLLLLAGSWLILNTINPKLLEFNLSSIGKLNKSSGTTGSINNNVSTPNTQEINDLLKNCRGVVRADPTTGNMTCYPNI